MRVFFARRKRLILIIAGLIVCVIGFEAWSRWLTVEPLDVPIALSPAGRVDRDVEIRRDCFHSLDFVFSIGTRPRREVGILVGAFEPKVGSPVGRDAGVKVPIKWSLVDRTGNVVASGESETAGIDRWTSTEFFRRVMRALPLPHGRYRLSAVVRRDIPELDGVSARLRLGCYNEKMSSGWQDNLLFAGLIVESLVVLPIAAILAAILLGLETSHLLRSRRRDPPA